MEELALLLIWEPIAINPVSFVTITGKAVDGKREYDSITGRGVPESIAQRIAQLKQLPEDLQIMVETIQEDCDRIEQENV